MKAYNINIFFHAQKLAACLLMGQAHRQRDIMMCREALHANIHLLIQPTFVEHLFGTWHFVQCCRKIVTSALNGSPMELTIQGSKMIDEYIYMDGWIDRQG